MQKWKVCLHSMFYRFCIVYALVMLLNLVIICANGHIGGTMPVRELLRIVLMAALCALGDLFLYIGGELPKTAELLRYLFHYVYINAVVILIAFQLIDITLPNLVIVLGAVALIYWINFITDFYRNKKDASKMNDLLEKINNNDQ